MRRNAFGRQVDSFEADLDVDGLDGDPFHAVFIRAPVVERAGDGVEVLASVDDRPVLARQGHVLVSSFHPELTDDRRLPPLLPRGGRLMSGHSKWATIKHKKGAADKKRGQALRQADPPGRGGGPRRAAATPT